MESTITPKQEQIRVLLTERGLSVDEVAAELSITKSAVYGHIRKMKEAGVPLPTTVDAVGARKARARNDVATLNSSPNAGRLIEEFKGRVAAERAAIQERIADLDRQREDLLAQVVILDEYEATLVKPPVASKRTKRT